MTIAQTDGSTIRKPLRLWPGVLAVAVQWLLRFVVPVLVPGAVIYGFFGALIGAVVVLLWWSFFSRAPWVDRLAAIAVTVVALFASIRLVDKSIATGAMGFLYLVLV